MKKDSSVSRKRKAAATKPALSLLDAADALGAKGGEGWRVLKGDSLQLLPKLPDCCADLIFADPPYNLQLKNELYRPNMTRVDGVDDSWDKFSSFEEYDEFCQKWLAECRRLLKPTGTIWVIGTYHNIGRITRLMQDEGYWLLNDVVWHKTNAMPNFRGVRFANATETLLWAKTSAKARYVFNHKLMKRENDGKQMPNVWRLPVCNGDERLRGSNGQKIHSTQKPEALLERIILSSTPPKGVVLDPFLGSGTTVAAALKCGRLGLGIELEAAYVKASVRRIKKVQLNRKPPKEPALPARVSFDKLVDSGMIPGGRFLYFREGEQRAKVLKNGELRLNGWGDGSIHRVGAVLAKSAECNGWVNWYLKEKGGFVCIDAIRQQYRDNAKRRTKHA